MDCFIENPMFILTAGFAKMFVFGMVSMKVEAWLRL